MGLKNSGSDGAVVTGYGDTMKKTGNQESFVHPQTLQQASLKIHKMKKLVDGKMFFGVQANARDSTVVH